MSALRDRPAWKALEAHHADMKDLHLRDLRENEVLPDLPYGALSPRLAAPAAA